MNLTCPNCREAWRLNRRVSGYFIYQTGNFVGTFRPIPIIGRLFGWYKLTWRYHD